MTGWSEYTLALALFTGSHFVPRIADLRGRMIASIGRSTYFALYGALSLVLLIWVVGAAIRAPYLEVWPQQPWSRWVPNLAMPLALMLGCCGVRLRQPFTLGARRGVRFDPADPGFAAVSRHPLLLALTLWAGAHLVPNGELAMVILFGSFAAMALLAIWAFDARARRVLAHNAEPFFARTALFSLRPLTSIEWLRGNARRLGWRALAGLALWLAALHLHAVVTGVPAFPT